MRQRLDLADIHADALRLARRRRIEGAAPAPLPDTCPLTLDDLLSRGFDPRAALARPRAADSA